MSPASPAASHKRARAILLVCFTLALFLPMAWLFWQLAHNSLGEKPFERMNHRLGMWGLRLLVANLALGVLFARGWLSRKYVYLRRPLGITTFVYVVTHVWFYVLKVGDPQAAFAQIPDENYLICGALAFLILAALTLTSSDWAVRSLGARGWKRLHRLVYFSLALVVLHFALFEKHHVTEILSLLLPLAVLYVLHFFLRGRSRRPRPSS